jgi:hypothetical protein
MYLNKMQLRTRFLQKAACLFLLAMGSSLAQLTTTISVAEGSNYCSVLSVEKRWNGVVLEAGYAFRWPDNTHDSLLFTIDRKGSYETLGPQPIYRIAMTQPLGITPATDADWNAGVTVTLAAEKGKTTLGVLQGHRPNTTDDGLYVTTDPRVFILNGQQLSKSGDLWDLDKPVLGSPQRSFFALQSWNGVLSNKTSGAGPFFIDIYQASTGKRVALIRGNRFGHTPDFIFYYSGWLTDHDLLMPFPFHGHPEILVCHIDR